MNSFWKMEARGALALMILLGVAGSTAGLGSLRAQDAARPKKVVFWAGPKEHGAPGRPQASPSNEASDTFEDLVRIRRAGA